MANPDHHEAAGLRRPESARSPTIRIPLHGKIDIAAAPATFVAIRERLPVEPTDLEFDLGDVDVLGAAGLSIFVTCLLEGHRVRCIHANGGAARVLATPAAAFLQRRDQWPD